MEKRFLLRPVKRMLILLSVLLSGTGIAQASPVAQAVWCSGNRTLYFVNVEPVSVGSAFDGQTVTAVWSGTDVTNSPSTSQWYSTARSATTVKFDSSFKDVKTKSLQKWFSGLGSLNSIIGIENLNTSEVTTMESMFSLCSNLTSIDISTFDISKVEDVSGMFSACTNLRTVRAKESSNIWDEEW